MARPNWIVNIPSSLQFYDINGNPVGPIEFTSDGRHGSEVTSGVDRRKPVGWLEPLSYSFISRKYIRAEGNCKFSHPGNPSLGGDYRGCVGGTGGRFNSLNHFNDALLESDLDTSGLANAALIAARIKLKRSSVNLGVAFAERGQTARLLGDTATRLARSFRSLRRGEVRNAMNHLGIASSKREPRGSNVPNKWLELQYGWKPLLGDIYGSCDALSKRNDYDWRVTATATRSSRVTGSVRYTEWDMGLSVALAELSVFQRIDALPGNSLLGSMASLGITNPLLIAWELVPYSFVVDWALPVGKWLESLDALLGYSSAYSSSSALIKAEWWDVGESGVYIGFNIDNHYAGSKKLVRLDRSVSNGVPLPTFPRIKDPRSLGHMANGLALLAGAFRR